MENLVLNVYDDENNVVKTVEATAISIKFGVVRQLMKLLKIDDVSDTAELFKVILDAWDEITKVLNSCFPEMTEEDWDNVRIDELIPTVVELLKGSFSLMLTIPQSGAEKN